MVMTSCFHPGDRGSIPLAGENIFYSIFKHIFNLVPNSQSAGYLSFQFTVPRLKTPQPVLPYSPPPADQSLHIEIL